MLSIFNLKLCFSEMYDETNMKRKENSSSLERDMVIVNVIEQ